MSPSTDPRSIVDLLLRKVTPEEVASRWGIQSGSLAGLVVPEEIDDLVERMHSSVDVLFWWHWAQHLRTGCELYRKVLSGSSVGRLRLHARYSRCGGIKSVWSGVCGSWSAPGRLRRTAILSAVPVAGSVLAQEHGTESGGSAQR